MSKKTCNIHLLSSLLPLDTYSRSSWLARLAHCSVCEALEPFAIQLLIASPVLADMADLG